MRSQNHKSITIQRCQFPDKMQEDKVVQPERNQDYFSLLCRNGPLPKKYHHQTDFFCVPIYFILLLGMIILTIANGFSGQKFTYEKQSRLNQDFFFGSKFFLWEIVFSAIGVMIISFVFTILALYMPRIMAFFSIIVLIGACLLFTIIQIKRFFSKEERIFSYIFKGVVSVILILIILAIIARRKGRILNLGLFLELSSKIIRPNMCLILTNMLILSVVQIVAWYGFASLYYGVSTVTKIHSKLIHFLTKLIVVIMWLWTSGFFIAFADYFITSYTVRWFYRLSKQEEHQDYSTVKSCLGQNVENFNQQQQQMDVAAKRYQPSKIMPVYSKFLKQAGTVIFGSILAYLPLYLISKTQKILFKSSTEQFKIVTFSKYGYLDTIMEQQGFINANYRVYALRKRIKSVMPQLYMLGHIYGDFTKLALIFIGVAGVHQLVQLKSDIAEHNQFLISYTFTLILFGIGLCSQIATNFTNLIGKCGDIAFYLYCIDLQIQRVHYSHNSNYSTPKSLLQILRQLTIKRNWKQNN